MKYFSKIYCFSIFREFNFSNLIFSALNNFFLASYFVNLILISYFISNTSHISVFIFNVNFFKNRVFFKISFKYLN